MLGSETLRLAITSALCDPMAVRRGPQDVAANAASDDAEALKLTPMMGVAPGYSIDPLRGSKMTHDAFSRSLGLRSNSLL